jgi:hypothetical protein
VIVCKVGTEDEAEERYLEEFSEDERAGLLVIVRRFGDPQPVRY